MSVKLDDFTVAEWFANKEQHKCGYCKSTHGSISYGMWVETMTVDDYQDLIDRGWRRSGKYCYKPTMNETCCPQYTIRCHANNLQLTKSQKKVIKKFNKFLVDGKLAPNVSEDSTCPNEDIGDIFIKERNLKDVVLSDELELDLEPIKTDSDKPKATQSDHKPINISLPKPKAESTKSKPFKQGLGCDPQKPACKKAKQLRLERKKEKLLKRGMSLEKLDSNAQKSLEQFIDDLPENCLQKLRLVLLSTSNPGNDWHQVKHTEQRLYAKYQARVHGDPPDKVTMKSFERFLVTSPLKYSTSSTGPGFGSFHQQYWIDDKLIAVGVIDILPKCVSSVYFFYDPDYRNLTLGTYGSLRELYFTRTLGLEYYYMGFYIHSCPKMLYKGKLVPSDLLCPETYKWFPIEGAIPKLDKAKYARLSDDQSEEDVDRANDDDLDRIKIVVCASHQLTEFRVFKRRYNEEEVFRNIGQLVGRKMCDRIIILK